MLICVLLCLTLLLNMVLKSVVTRILEFLLKLKKLRNFPSTRFSCLAESASSFFAKLSSHELLTNFMYLLLRNLRLGGFLR